MTYDQYIQNPMGVANAVISNRNMYRELYMNKLNKILVREMGKIDYALFKSKDKYYVYIKIPSEVIEKFYYDVVIEFSEPEDKKLLDNSLNNYTVKFYSNDPSFVYTFAHAFIKNNMFINELKGVMSKQAIQKVATEKNPQDQVGYVKSLYFAYLILKKENVFNKNKFMAAKKINWKELQSVITPADVKIAQRQDAAKEKAAKKKRIKNTNREIAKNAITNDINLFTSDTKRVRGSKVIKAAKVTEKNTKTVKKTKKI